MKDKIKSPKLSDGEKAAEMESRARQHDFYLTRGGSTTPIALSSVEYRVMCALTAFISRPEELECGDVKRKLSAPFKSLYDVSRHMLVGWLAHVIYGSNSRDYRETIWKALYNLANTYQRFKLSNGRCVKTPLIAIGGVFGKGKDIDLACEVVEIIFGGQIFVDINNVADQLQEVWDIIDPQTI